MDVGAQRGAQAAARRALGAHKVGRVLALAVTAPAVALLLGVLAEQGAHTTGVRALPLDDLGVGAGALAPLAPRRAREVLVVAVAESRRRREEADQSEQLHLVGDFHVAVGHRRVSYTCELQGIRRGD